MQKISLVISNSVTKEVLERWDFKVQYEGDGNGNAVENGETVGNKDLKLIQKEIRSVLRQITATVSVLPLLDCLCKYEA
jgi:mitotic spindle assembly checkpoint protein MAD2